MNGRRIFSIRSELVKMRKLELQMKRDVYKRLKDKK